MSLTDRESPYAIAMWDFSWLERRYAGGGGYEDWDRVLDELVERGTTRSASTRTRIWSLGTRTRRGRCRPPSRPATGARRTPARSPWARPLTEFVGKCAERDVAVALSSWFREDETGARRGIWTPADLATVWIDTPRPPR